jgi:DNA-binding PadR family transcriptional regulator
MGGETQSLRPADVLILMMLVRGNRHGYGIMRDVAEHTEGEVQLEAGSLYRSLRRLLDDGLVVEASPPAPATGHEDERRRYYALTAAGRRALAAEALRMRRLVRVAEAAGLIAPAGATPAGATPAGATPMGAA